MAGAAAGSLTPTSTDFLLLSLIVTGKRNKADRCAPDSVCNDPPCLGDADFLLLSD
jgi:hypothetical protein